ncbi:MAG: protein-glutamate O-methyltransferase CheR [Actinobacteria bacterium]|nr:protein-glutamate O-methyltransferase CheR [Actinomycetota bacterium]
MVIDMNAALTGLCEKGAKGAMFACELEEEDFWRISSLMYRCCRVNLHEGKKTLVQSRLNKRLRALGLEDFNAYWQYMLDNEEEVVAMVDCLTTNHTHFFRGPEHFDFLSKRIFPALRERKEDSIRIWSAGCSSGEEPYSLAMALVETIEDVDTKDALVLATDISRKALERAKRGVYGKNEVYKVPPELRIKYFDFIRDEESGEMLFKVKDVLARLVRPRFLNLVDQWPMKHPFDVILCRNVMIYFDRETQRELIKSFWRALKPGGILIVGHCESLAGMMSRFEFLCPTIYSKIT